MDRRLYRKLSETLPQTKIVQKNWDLSQDISDEIFELLKGASTECPNSHKGDRYYNVHFIKNRDIIDRVYKSVKPENEEIIANLLVVFEKSKGIFYNSSSVYGDNYNFIESSMNRSVGIAVGNLVLISHLMGLSTGICQDFKDDEGIKNIMEVLELQELPLMMVGIGYNNNGIAPNRSHIDKNKKHMTYRNKAILVKEWS